jgi:hypothetical protein
MERGFIPVNILMHLKKICGGGKQIVEPEQRMSDYIRSRLANDT